MIKYEQMSVFDAPAGSLLAHACNCQGTWGSGVAVGFKEKFPKAFQEHHLHCQNLKYKLVGSTDIHQDGEFKIGCLFTSRGYGKFKDSEKDILQQTKEAIEDLFTQLKGKENKIYSPKINAGLFAVPWERTETIINELLIENPNIEWTVCLI